MARTTDRGRKMTVKELKKVIEILPDDFEIVISADIGGNRPCYSCLYARC